MTLFSYHASQEQFAPQQLLSWVLRAEHAGFDAVFTSDHLQPWAPAQGESAFTWSWLGAAMQATQRLTFATISVPGGWRYSPVVLAQAAGTLATMYPGRIPWIALGSGEALNEAALGPAWPNKEERNRRLLHGARSMKSLLQGHRVISQGPPEVRDARLWCKPAAVPQLIGAATSEATAEWLGSWADGLLTIGPGIPALRDRIGAFRRGGGAGKPVYIKVDLSWAETEEEALREAHQRWRFNAVDDGQGELRQPEDFEIASRHISPEAMRERVFVSADPRAHAEHLAACMALGVQGIDLHQVGRNQADFIDVFGRVVLPGLRTHERTRSAV